MGIIIAIIIIICKCKCCSTKVDNEEVTIIFSFNQEKIPITINRQKNWKHAIKLYLKKKQFQNEKNIRFLFDGCAKAFDEFINNNDEIGKLFPKDIKEKTIIVDDMYN